MKLIKWITGSNRHLHFLCALTLGLAANDWYSTALGTLAVAFALEYKDKTWGGKWDWMDILFTAAGGFGGYGLRCLIFKAIETL